MLCTYSWPSVSLGFASMESTNLKLKIPGERKNPIKFQKANLEFATHQALRWTMQMKWCRYTLAYIHIGHHFIQGTRASRDFDMGGVWWRGALELIPWGYWGTTVCNSFNPQPSEIGYSCYLNLQVKKRRHKTLMNLVIMTHTPV